MSRQKGFTLIELVVVIVILGLLAATALPRFVDLTSNARLASVQGVAGGLRSAVALTRAAWLVQGSSGALSVTMDGLAVATTASGYPDNTATGIGRALPVPDGYLPPTFGVNPVAYRPSSGSASCEARYDASTAQVTVMSTC